MPFKKATDHSFDFLHPQKPTHVRALATDKTRRINPFPVAKSSKKGGLQRVPRVTTHAGEKDRRGELQQASARRHGRDAVSGVGVSDPRTGACPHGFKKGWTQ
jgi:hypothetical protein